MSVLPDDPGSRDPWPIGPEPARRSPWGLGLSLALHLAVGLFLLAVGRAPPISSSAPVSAIAVEILPPPSSPVSAPSSARTPTAAPSPARAPEPVAPAPAEPPPRAATRVPESTVPPPPPEPAPPAMVRATRMLSAAGLDDRRSRQARQALAAMAAEDRAIQLCDLEAMAQVAAWKSSYAADQVVAHAAAEVEVAGDTVVADGAVFHSRDRWYALRFRCGLTPDHAKVASFEFLVGDPLSSRQRRRYDLPAEGGDLD